MSMTRTNITLPPEVSSEIIQKAQEESAVMRLARQIPLPGSGVSIPVILGDPQAAWVAEGGEKPVSDSTVTSKLLTPYKLAVIEVFSEEFVRDAARLYDALRERLPKTLGLAFDATVFGKMDKPGENFDTFADVDAVSITTDAYDHLVDIDTGIALNDGMTDGYVISPQGKGVLLKVKDENGRPIFINNVSEDGIPTILGSPTYLSKGAYEAGTADTPETLGFAGDWTKAIYGTVEGVKYKFSDQATVKINGEQVNLWQKNMVGIIAEIEIGFRADTTVFRKMTGENGEESE